MRKLRTNEFRAQPSDADADGSVLVIGEPLVDETRYPPLPGAREEAIAVAARLTSGPAGLDAAHVRALTSGNDDARNIINALFERSYRVIHVAGHGAPAAKGGVVLSGNTFLGAAEVQAMRVVPELVFLNCCHLAARDAQSTLASYDRAEFAANIAEALIEVGVRCVIAAGWAVEDEPAEIFATTFYDSLLAGGRFIDAVAAARVAAWRASGSGNTWAAYQCYGDPGWTWQRGGKSYGTAASPGDEFAAVSSAPALTLETISIRLRFGSAGGASLQAQRDKLRFLEAKFAPLWGTMGAVAEAFGLAFADARDLDKAIDWYRTAVRADDGSASFKAAEQLGDQLARRGAARRGRRRFRARPARRRRGDRPPRPARGDAADRGARGAARLGLQAAGHDRRPQRRERAAHPRPATPRPARRCRRPARGAACGLCTTAMPSAWRNSARPTTSSIRPRTASAPS